MKTLRIDNESKDGVRIIEFANSILRNNPKAAEFVEDDDWKNNLHLPGKPLTDEQWEILDKENEEDPGVNARVFFDDLKKKHGWK